MKSTEDVPDAVERVITYDTRCEARTTSIPDFVDITEDIAAAVERSEVRHGRALVFAAEESCTIMVNERESGLLEDLKRTIAKLGPRPGEPARPLVGSSSVVLPIDQGKLQLGMWQRVLLVELSDAAPRTVDIQVIGER